ncbi:MAG: prepilin-type N-terminal cleavage/methylation domain-containing protein [Planctomycetales bacterium]|nr:prepilin-type N-terminal cleavage/methylation domain-containing protein [Planctomycetales bacterium]
MRIATSSSQAGFSLLELIVVLVLVALLAAVIVVRWSSVQQRAVTASAISQLQFLDQHLRSYARLQRTACGLSFDLRNHRVRKLYHAQDRNNPAWEKLGRGVHLDSLRTTVPQQNSRDEIVFAPDGTSPTYIVQLTCPGNQQLWLLCAGSSGQFTQFPTEREADAALALVSRRF